MRRWFLAFAALALLAAVPPSNQVVTYNDLINNQTGNFTWASTPPTGSPHVVTYARYKALVANTTAAPCPIATATGGLAVTWNMVISCASVHTATQQSESVSGSDSTITFTARFDAPTGQFVCSDPIGSDSFTGTPIVLPAGTVAPSASTPLSLNLTSIIMSGSVTFITVQLKNPSGGVALSSGQITTSTWSSGNYTTAGPAGAWSWVITDSGATDGTCDTNNGASGGGTQMRFSGTATWFQ